MAEAGDAFDKLKAGGKGREERPNTGLAEISLLPPGEYSWTTNLCSSGLDLIVDLNRLSINQTI